MHPLAYVLLKAKTIYILRGENINHLLFMDDLKLHGKSEKKNQRVSFTVEVFSVDIGMEFGFERCGVIIMNRGKVKSTDWIELLPSD